MIEGHSAEKQRDLRRKCHHPTSVWQPLDQPDPDTPIPEHIAARALEIPDHLAVFDTEVAFTFSESDCLANQISHAILTALGPGQEAVALLVGLHAPAAAAALGVMKAGKFYVAVEETYSRNRALDILEDSKARLIITDEEHYSAALDLARGDHVAGAHNYSPPGETRSATQVSGRAPGNARRRYDPAPRCRSQ